ncbi:MAG: class I SAM-dependent methyltransferase [Candidatus Moraniibacteriota bacterium]
MRLTDHIIRRFDEAYRRNEAYWVREEIPENVKTFAKNVERKFPKGKLLDLGCGNGWLSFYFAQQGFVVSGIDSSKEAVRLARTAQKQLSEKRVIFTVGDVLELPYKEKSFDIIFDKGLFHHLPQLEWGQYKRGLLKVLKQGGLFYLSVFSDQSVKRGFSPKQSGRLWHRSKDSIGYWNYDHFFTEALLRKIFRRGFEIVSIESDKQVGLHGSHKPHVIIRRV